MAKFRMRVAYPPYKVQNESGAAVQSESGIFSSDFFFVFRPESEPEVGHVVFPYRMIRYLFIKPVLEVQYVGLAVFLLLFAVLVVGKTEGLRTKNKRLAQTRNYRFGSFLKVADTATLDPTVSTSTTAHGLRLSTLLF